jgi:energy-coupling factor transport system substrate-specific component
VAFFWPFVVVPGTFSSTETPPLMFGVLLALILAVVFAEIADGGIDAKALAMLGVLSAINAALRPLDAGTAGIETVFFLLVLAGRVFGAGFGFALGCTSLFASALLTGGVGPWMPYQMFGCAWIGMLAGLLPPLRGKAEIAMLAAYGAVAGYLFGFLLNLSFWPFSVDPTSSIAYRPGLSFLEQWHRYLLFDATTSLGWDTGRAVTNVVAILLAGPAILAAFRRAARRANFQPAAGAEPTYAGPELRCWAAGGSKTRTVHPKKTLDLERADASSDPHTETPTRCPREAGACGSGRRPEGRPTAPRHGRYAGAMTDDVALIIQLPAGSAVDRQLELDPPPSVADGRAVIERITADVAGTIQPPEAGQVVLSFLSPEDLRREAEQIRQEIRPGDGGEPPVVVIEVAEELREDELAGLLQAAEEASRVVILCILGSVLDELQDGVQRRGQAGEVQLGHHQPRVVLLALGSGSHEPVQLIVQTSQTLGGLLLQEPQRWQLTLTFDDPLDCPGAERADQLVLEISVADEESELPQRNHPSHHCAGAVRERESAQRSAGSAGAQGAKAGNEFRPVATSSAARRTSAVTARWTWAGLRVPSRCFASAWYWMRQRPSRAAAAI